MEERKLSEELRFCIEQDGCSKCSCFETQSKLTCPSLLKKAYEVVKRYEEMFPFEVGDMVFVDSKTLPTKIWILVKTKIFQNISKQELLL